MNPTEFPPTIPPPAERRPLDELEMHGYPAAVRRIRDLEKLLDQEVSTRRMMISGLETCIREQNRRIAALEEQLAAVPKTGKICACNAPIPVTRPAQLHAWLRPNGGHDE